MMNPLPNLTEYSLADLRNLEAATVNAQSAWRETAANANRRADQYGRNLVDIRAAIARAQIDPNGPLTDEQRRALFGAFRDAGLSDSNEDRYRFTRAVLGKPATATVSWARYKPGRITYGEASHLLDVLAALQ